MIHTIARGVFAGILLMTTTGAWAQDAKDIYLDKCSVCHGATGLGNTAKGRKLKVKSIKDTVKKYNEDEMNKIVAEGKGTDMDGFGKQLSKEQITALVTFYRNLAK